MVYVSGIIVYNVYDGVSGKKEEEKNMCQVGRAANPDADFEHLCFFPPFFPYH